MSLSAFVLFEEAFYKFFDVCAAATGKVLPALEVCAVRVFGKVASAPAQSAAAARAEGNELLALPVLAFGESIHDFRRIGPPDGVAQDYRIIVRYVNLAGDGGAALGIVALNGRK